jgi:CheY-like chemotaxis protein
VPDQSAYGASLFSIENSDVSCDGAAVLPILVVEDDVPTQLLFKALLTRYGHTIEIAPSGAEAIERLRAGDYALVILDLMMPGVSGEDVIGAMRVTGRSIPVIVCTAAGPIVTARLDGQVVKSIIRKPFEIDELTATVAALLPAPPPEIAPTRILVIDDDSNARYVIRAFLSDSEVSEAETGEGAVDLIRQNRPDIVFLDLTLPGTPGEEVLRRLHETLETRDLPVVIVTSRKLDEKERASLLRHATAVIYKGDLSRETLREVMQGIRKG